MPRVKKLPPKSSAVSSPRGDGPRVEVVRVAASTLVTLENPDSRPQAALSGAFVRLRPPAGTTPERASAWREEVSRSGARAVRLLPVPRAADVPFASARARSKPLAPRQEVERLLEEADDPDLSGIVRAISEEVGL